jgi:dihydroorotate dehydrogenase (fumarate)
MWLERAADAVDIPVIASLNAVNRETWIDYARQLADTGVDGLELNFYYTPEDAGKSAEEIESEQVAILEAIKEKVALPIGVKLSYFYSNPLHVVKRMDAVGVDGFVLFNRLFESDINIEEEQHTTPLNLSNPGDHKLALRFAGMLYDQIDADICANTGFLSGADVVKANLAGASCVQVVSALYRSGVSAIGGMLAEIERWLDGRNYATLADCRGKLARKNLNDPFLYKRAQYVDLLLRSDELVTPRDIADEDAAAIE